MQPLAVDHRDQRLAARVGGPRHRVDVGWIGEQAILDSGLENYFILRTSWLYGPGGKNFVETIIRLAREREELRIVADQIGTPTYTEDLAEAIFRLLSLSPHAPYGFYHFSNEGQCSWYDFACAIVE